MTSEVMETMYTFNLLRTIMYKGAEEMRWATARRSYAIKVLFLLI